ncbi:MAG: DNA polymerase I [Candidatus Kapabacteria bacterium]|nr:DNA polymerase I [Candidatus Kapabacteria bacterium]
MKKLFLIDGMSLVFRAHHAMIKSGLKSPSGEPTGALFGFTNMISSLLERENPEYISVAFDREEPTFRHERYEAYKANRAEFPEELIPQLPRIKQFLELAGIKCIEIPRFEADDIIGTIAKNASANEWQAVCVTSDKDYYQLVDEKVTLMKPGRKGEDFEYVGINEVKEKFGVRPDQVIDVLALIGDASDNVPGVKGIGEKTAIPLVVEFGSVEAIYENLDKIEKLSVRTKLEGERDMAMLSKELVTIDTNMQLEPSLEDLKKGETQFIELDKLFAEAGFNTIREKWRRKSNPEIWLNVTHEVEQKQHDNFGSIDKDYRLIDSIEKLDALIGELSKAHTLSFDLETTGLDRATCNIVGIAISIAEFTGCYIPVYYDEDNLQEYSSNLFSEKKPAPRRDNQIPVNLAISKLAPILTNPNIKKCGQNIKFDMSIMKRHGVDLSPIAFDSMVASYVLDPDEKHNLNDLSKKWLNYEPIPISSLIGEKKSEQISMSDVDPEIIKDYASEDADLALRLYAKLDEALAKDKKLFDLAHNIEFPLIEVLTQMEANGICIDTSALLEVSKQIEIEATDLQRLIFAEAGIEFNIDSPKQLAEILFEKMQIPPIKKNKTGYSTDVQVLNELSISYPIASYIVEYRQIQKLKSTYVDSLPRLINKTTGRIHTTYNQTVASTGRLSSTDPNLQNIPIRTDKGKEIRKAFIAKNDDYVIMSADYSQIELRIMAHICGDEQMIDSFRQNHDIHSATASVLFSKPLEEVNQDMRRIAKTVNFGIMYGLGSFGLAQRLRLSRSEAKEIIDNYFAKYSGIKKYMDLTVEFTRKHGYAETLCGRRRYFQDIDNKNFNLRNAAERAAINLPIQGTASDMLKIAMITIHNEFAKNKYNSKMLLQVHDELVFEVQKSEIDEIKSLVIDKMSSALSLGEVPVIVETGIGSNWLEAH